MRVLADKKEKKGFTVSKHDSITIIMGIVGLFLGRVALFGFLNPVAVAFLSSYILKGYRLYVISVLTTIGLLTRYSGGHFIKYLISVMIIIAIHVILDTLDIRINKLVKGGIAAFAVLAPGLVLASLNGTYYIIMSFFEGILAFALVLLMGKGIAVLEGTPRYLNNESLLSCAILLGGLVAGMADIYIGNMSVKFFVCALIVLIMAGKGGSTVGATTGVLLGLILSITGSIESGTIAVLSVAGMIAGLTKTRNNIGTIGGFVGGGAIAALYFDLYLLNLGMLYSVALAGAAFSFAPKNLNLSFEEATDSEYINKTKEYITYRLKGFSRSFHNLSTTFSSLSEKKTTLDQHDASRLIDEVANKTCLACPKRDTCWGKEFYNTYQMFFSLLGTAEKEGGVGEIPPHMKNFCIQKENLLTNINRTFDIYKNNLLWHNKILESRELVSQQLKGVGDIIGNLARELELDLKFSPALEQQILQELNRRKVEVDSVVVIENNMGKYEVTLNYSGAKRSVSQVTELISTVLGRKMTEDESYIKKSTLRLAEEQKFMISSGVAKAPKEAGQESGDSFSAMHIRGKMCLLMLSDGMGSGSKAREESAATIEIFEDFVETGFDKETAIKMINSVLVLKSNEDSFSTLDICAVDLYTGVCEFVKMGASTTFVLRDGLVQVVRNTALPLGILNDVEIEVIKKRLRNGDIIVMVTDGVTDDSQSSKENFLIDTLAESKISNPQDLAEYILECSKGDGKLMDDMTVLVAKVWER